MKTDTIAAIATGITNSGIGIIRISGNDSVSIADKIFRSSKIKLKDAKSHTIHYGYIYEGEKLLDEVMVSVMRAPKSFTAEDTVEINCHGGVFIMNKILELVIKNGARIAQPGEFTKRAFLNGRLDLSEAEAVMDVIGSQNEAALEASVKQLKGSVHRKIRELREKILYEIAFIESALDDPEHISLEGYKENLQKKVTEILAETERLLDSADNGRLIKEGIKTVIVGKPNVGKSSFLNYLLGEERAIVTEIAGTTRDALEEQLRLDEICLNMIDTAGIRNTEDVVEKIGVERTKEYVKDADLIVYIVDGSCPLDENDEDIIRRIGSKKCIVLLNKSDLESVVTEKEIWSFLYENNISMENFHILKISAKEKTGLSLFKDTVKEMFFQGKISLENELMITNMRHKEALMEAADSLHMVQKSLEEDMPEDFYSIDLMSAYSSLGRIIGEEIGDDLVNEIFAKFCMGK